MVNIKIFCLFFFFFKFFKELNDIIGKFSIYLPILFKSSSTKATGLKFRTLEIYRSEATPVLPAPNIRQGFFNSFKLFEFFIFKKVLNKSLKFTATKKNNKCVMKIFS